MKFVSPAFLYALFVLSIPIIIHLFNFRRYKRIQFSNVKFLKEVQEQTQAKSKLKHLLVLLFRLLALTFLVLAFAQPYMPLKNSKVDLGEKAVSVFIDNSFSMEASGKYGTLLDESRKRASEILKAYALSDRFQLLTNDFEGKHQRMVNKDVFSQMLDEVHLSPQSKSIEEILTRQYDLLNSTSAQSKHIYIITDLQQSNFNLSKVKGDSNVAVHFVPVFGNTQGNIWIDSCWFNSPVRQINVLDSVQVKIVNGSEHKIEDYPVKLFIDGSEKVPATVTIDPGQSKVVSFRFTMRAYGRFNAWVELKDYPVTYDDRYYFSFNIENKLKVLQIGNQDKDQFNDPISRLFTSDSLFQYLYADVKKIDYSKLSFQQLVIINGVSDFTSGFQQEIKKYIENGGNVFVIPSTEINYETYNLFLNSLGANTLTKLDTTNLLVDKIDLDHFIFKNVFESKPDSKMDKPKVLSHFVLTENTRTTERVLLTLRNGDKYLVHYGQKGNVYLLSSALTDEHTGFHKHALFVPVLYNMALYNNTLSKSSFTIGDINRVDLKFENSGDRILHLKNQEHQIDIIPELRTGFQGTEMFLNNQVKHAGVFKLIDEKAEVIEVLAFNYKRTESVLKHYSVNDIEEQIIEKGLKNMDILDAGERPLNLAIAEQHYGKKLWKLCVILSLIFLAFETLVLRFLKN